MPVFESTEKMYDVLGGALSAITDDPAISKKFNEKNINVRFVYNNPSGEIWVMHGDEKPYVLTGPSGIKADVEMWISGDDSHAFWLKKLNLPVAMAKRKVKSKGPTTKVLALLPLLKPAYEKYPSICKEKGIPV
jgi:hypothetical protein